MVQSQILQLNQLYFLVVVLHFSLASTAVILIWDSDMIVHEYYFYVIVNVIMVKCPLSMAIHLQFTLFPHKKQLYPCSTVTVYHFYFLDRYLGRHHTSGRTHCFIFGHQMWYTDQQNHSSLALFCCAVVGGTVREGE